MAKHDLRPTSGTKLLSSSLCDYFVLGVRCCAHCWIMHVLVVHMIVHYGMVTLFPCPWLVEVHPKRKMGSGNTRGKTRGEIAWGNATRWVCLVFWDVQGSNKSNATIKTGQTMNQRTKESTDPTVPACPGHPPSWQVDAHIKKCGPSMLCPKKATTRANCLKIDSRCKFVQYAENSGQNVWFQNLWTG